MVKRKIKKGGKMNKKVLYIMLSIILFILLTYFCVLSPTHFVLVLFVSINIIVALIYIIKTIVSKNFSFLILPGLLLILFTFSFITGNFIYNLIQQKTNKRAEVIIEALDKFYQNNKMYPKSIKEIIPKYLKTSDNNFKEFLYIGNNDQFELYVRDKNCGHRYKSITKKWFYNSCP